MLPGSDKPDMSDIEEPLGASPPLELRKSVVGARTTVPLSLQSPQDRTTGNYIFFF